MNLRSSSALPVCAAVAGLFFSLPGHATFVNSTTASAANFSTNTTLTFDEKGLAAGTTVTNQYSGVNFSPRMVQRPQDCSGFAHMTNACIGNWPGDTTASGGVSNPFTIAFDSQQTQAGFNMVTNDGDALFEALLNNAVVDSATAKVLAGNDDPSELNFFGFTGLTFDSIRVTVRNTPDAGFALIDNLTFNSAPNPAPEPGSLALAGLALSSLLVAGRRRRPDH